MNLPKKYKSRSGHYSELDGKPKLSYSQYNSYKDPEYQNDYYVQYFMGIKLPSGEFAEFGNFVGTYISDKEIGGLSEEDIKILDNVVDFPENCVYEDEVALDLGDFVVEGYIDRSRYLFNNVVDILDYKTGNLDKKASYYASEDYGQTALYCYFKEKQGFKIGVSEVFMLGRKGTSLQGSGNHKMRLSGEYKIIPTPYTTERGEQVIADIKKVARQISNDYTIYQKIFE